MRLFLLSMALFSCSSAWGEADIELSVSLIGGNFVPPGVGASVEVRWVNHGPGPAINVAAGTLFLVGAEQSTLAIGTNAQTPPCRVSTLSFSPSPGNPTTFVSTIFSDPTTLQPGEVAVCIVGLITYPDSPALITQTFAGFPQDGDPALANNSATLRVFTGNGSTAVPTGGTGTWLVLTVGLLILGFIRIRISKLASSGQV